MGCPAPPAKCHAVAPSEVVHPAVSYIFFVRHTAELYPLAPPPISNPSHFPTHTPKQRNPQTKGKKRTNIRRRNTNLPQEPRLHPKPRHINPHPRIRTVVKGNIDDLARFVRDVGGSGVPIQRAGYGFRARPLAHDDEGSLFRVRALDAAPGLADVGAED